MIPVRYYADVLWNGTLGPGLVLLIGSMSFLAARTHLPYLNQPVRRYVFLTPLVMLAAAIVTPTPDTFNMIILFLLLCVACTVGVSMAEVTVARSAHARAPLTRILLWGFRFGAESVLGAGVAFLILRLWP